MNSNYRLVADYVAGELLTRVRGDIRHPATWHDVADCLNCLLVSHRCDRVPPGQYFPASADGGHGIIVHNCALPARLRCLVLVHELSHHVMMRETMESLFGHVRAYGYTGSDGARDEIARAVESIIFPGIRRSAAVRRFQAGTR